jgi:hypothetical protein
MVNGQKTPPVWKVIVEVRIGGVTVTEETQITHT